MSGAEPRIDGALGFVFLAAPNSDLIHGFRVNGDGSLASVPGSPFTGGGRVRALAAMPGVLLAARESAVDVYRVDGESGSLEHLGSTKMAKISRFLPEADRSKNAVIAFSESGVFALQLVGGKLLETPAPGAVAADTRRLNATVDQPAVLDASGRFMYTIDSVKSEITAFRVEEGKPVPLSPASYSIPHGTSSIIFVTP